MHKIFEFFLYLWDFSWGVSEWVLTGFWYVVILKLSIWIALIFLIQQIFQDFDIFMSDICDILNISIYLIVWFFTIMISAAIIWNALGFWIKIVFDFILYELDFLDIACGFLEGEWYEVFFQLLGGIGGLILLAQILLPIYNWLMESEQILLQIICIPISIFVFLFFFILPFTIILITVSDKFSCVN